MIKFTPEDFNISIDDKYYAPIDVLAANYANAKLAEWLSSAVKVYGHQSKLVGDWGYFTTKDNMHTHSALLIDIKEIEKPKIIDREQADQMSAKICGLNLEQVAQVKDFYERITGNKADKL